MHPTHEHLNRFELTPLDHLLGLDYELLLDSLNGQQVEEQDDLRAVIKPVSQFINSSIRGMELTRLAMEEGKFSGDVLSLKSYLLYTQLDISKKAIAEFEQFTTSIKIVLASQFGQPVGFPEDGLENTISFVRAIADHTSQFISGPFIDPCNRQMELDYSPS